MEVLKIKLGDKGRLTFQPNFPMQEFRSILGDYSIVFHGVVDNSDAYQLSTPAGIRAEHPFATMVSCEMEWNPTLKTMERLARQLVHMGGAFVAAWLSKTMQRVMVVVRNLPMWFKPSTGTLVTDQLRGINNAVYMFGPAGNLVDSIDISIPFLPQGRRLYVVESLRNDWSRSYGYRPQEDTRVSYTILGPVFRGPPKDIMEAADLILHACRFAIDLEQVALTSIVLGFTPQHLDLLEVNTLTRLTYIASDRKYTLELPRYDEALGHRVYSAC